MMTPVLHDNTLYLGDNGICLCGKCSGASARFTGRDISGQKVRKVTADDRAYMAAEWKCSFECEGCGKQ